MCTYIIVDCATTQGMGCTHAVWVYLQADGKDDYTDEQ